METLITKCPKALMRKHLSHLMGPICESETHKPSNRAVRIYCNACDLKTLLVLGKTKKHKVVNL